MDFLSAIILGIVQALTEFLPISSSGHLILAREILNQNTNYGLSVDAVLQLATTFSILVYFRKEIFKIANSFIKLIFFKKDTPENRNTIWLMIVATIPAVFLGLILENTMDTILRNPKLIIVTLILGAVIMFLAEKMILKNKNSINNFSNLNKKQALKIGLFQSLALIPGMSRSGMTISGGLFSGLNREMATRFSFIIAFPVLFGSGLKKLFDLYQAGLLQSFGLEIFSGFLVSFVVGLFVIHFLICFLKKHTLKIFIWYRLVLALILLLLLI